MTWFLVILGILILLAVLLSRIRLGVRLTWEPGSLTAEASIGPFRIRLYPPAQRKKSAAPPPAPKAAAQPQPKKHTAFPKPTAGDLRLALETLLPPLRRGAGPHQTGHSHHPPGDLRHYRRGRRSRQPQPSFTAGFTRRSGPSCQSWSSWFVSPSPPSILGSILTRIPPYPAERSVFS